MDNISASIFGEEQWLGLDAYNDRANIAPGNVARLENLTAEAGRLERRPGLVAQWTTNLPGPPHALRDVVQTDSDIHIWFASGTGLYRYVPGETAPHSITLPGGVTLSAPHVVIRQIGGYVYVVDDQTHDVDGQEVGLLRFQADGSSAPAIGLQVPNKPTNVTLTNLAFPPLDAPGMLIWESLDVANLNNLITDVTDANTGTSGEYWDQSPSGVSFFTMEDIGETGCRLAGVGNYIETRDMIELDPNEKIDPDDEDIYPKVFALSFQGRTYQDEFSDDITSRLKVTLKLYSELTDTDPTEERSVHIGLMLNQSKYWFYTFDCRDIPQDIKGFKLRIENANAGIVGDDPLFRKIALYTGGQEFYFPAPAPTLIAQTGTVYASPTGNACTDGAQPTVEQLPQDAAFYTRDKRFYTTLGAPEDLTTTQRITARVKLLYAATADVPIRLFIENEDRNRAYSPLTYLSPNVGTTLNFDVTTVDHAIRSAVLRIGIEFAGDVPTSGYAGNFSGNSVAESVGVPAASPPLLELTVITKPGNLTTDTSVYYRIEEWDTSVSDGKLLDVIISDGSPVSDVITPTITDAVGVITLDERVNDNASRFAIYRFGDFADGRGRLLGLYAYAGPDFDFDEDLPKGTAPYYAAPANPYLDITFSTPEGNPGTVIIDNTPTSWLLEKTTYTGGREVPPKKIREIVEWQNRIWLLAGEGRRSELYGSWLLSVDSNAGLYFSRIVSPTDPSLAIKGVYTHIGTEDGDKALRLIPLEDRLFTLFERKPPYLILGTDPSNIELRPFVAEGGSALGLIARNAACLFGGAICYLTANGLVAWDTATAPRRLSELVRKLVSPRLGGQSSYLAGATEKIALWEHGGRLYLALPTAPVDTEPNRILTFDPESGWSLFPDIAATGGLDLPGSDNASGHYIATASGNLALLTLGSGDKATAGATETAIPFALTTRALGNNSTVSKSPYRLELDLENTDPDDEQVFTVSMADNRGVSRWRKDVTYPAGAVHRLSTRPGSIRSETFAVSVSGSSRRGVVIGILRVGASVGGGRL